MLTYLALLYMGCVTLTSRIRVHSTSEDSIRALREKRNVVFTFWYEDILFLLSFFGKYRMPVLITALSKNDKLAKLSELLGLRTARGTAEGGGRHALMVMLEQLKGGKPVLVPADSPHGQVRKCKAGCIFLAQGAQVPLVPVSWSSLYNIRIKTRHGKIRIPLPFNAIQIELGAPHTVQPHYDDSEFEGLKTQVETQINRLRAAPPRTTSA